MVSVSINQQQATLGEGGLAFSFHGFFVREGTNMITAVATDAAGRISTAANTLRPQRLVVALNPANWLALTACDFGRALVWFTLEIGPTAACSISIPLGATGAWGRAWA